MSDSFVTLQTVACQAPLSVGLPRQEYWSGFPFPPLKDLSDPGFELASLMSSGLGGRFFTTSTTSQICISKKFTGNADVSGPEAKVQEPMAKSEIEKKTQSDSTYYNQ